MGAMEMNLGPSPVICDSIGLEWRSNTYEEALRRAIASVVVHQMAFEPGISNAAISTPLIVSYARVEPFLKLPEEVHEDLDDLTRGMPLRVVGRGRVVLRKGRLPEPEWDL